MLPLEKPYPAHRPDCERGREGCCWGRRARLGYHEIVRYPLYFGEIPQKFMKLTMYSHFSNEIPKIFFHIYRFTEYMVYIKYRKIPGNFFPWGGLFLGYSSFFRGPQKHVECLLFGCAVNFIQVIQSVAS